MLSACSVGKDRIMKLMNCADKLKQYLSRGVKLYSKVHGLIGQYSAGREEI